MAVVFKTLSATLSANVNEVTFTDSIINSNSVIEVYYNSNDVYTLETWQDGTTIGIVTSDHNFAVGVKVTINNVTSFEPYDDTNLVNRIDGLSDDVSALDGRLDTAEDDIDSLETRMGSAEDDIDALESGKQDVLTAGDGIVIEDNIISSTASGAINYSTTEQEIGTWIDGSKLYRKVFDVGSVSPPTNHAWYDTGIDISYIQTIIRSATTTGSTWNTTIIDVFKESNHLQLVNLGSSGVSLRYVIMEYTKVTT